MLFVFYFLSVAHFFFLFFQLQPLCNFKNEPRAGVLEEPVEFVLPRNCLPVVNYVMTVNKVYIIQYLIALYIFIEILGVDKQPAAIFTCDFK